ncbi:uncharacterized protein LOC103506400 [Diaphorina citri]|uniref:Uncharacterized protein LOC103506400 n=1 Tax=Diaphorina citri TaxID=121845 RepID=A0A3Q0IRK6_DIACI|nr:uncharacterized protein LOC103506400 [Diaphorina citri]
MWSNIKKLEYQKHSFCLITQVKGVKFKFKMDNHKSYYVFHLASLHHKFFCKLRLEMSLKSLSDEFGVPVLSKSKLDSKKIYVLKEKDKKKPSPPKQTVSLNSNRANILQPLCNNPKVLGLNSDNNRSNLGFNSHSGTIKKGYNPGFDPHDENIKGCKLGFEPHSGNMKGSNPGFTSHSENIKGSNPLKPCNNGEMAKTLPRALMKCTVLFS